MKMPSGLVIQDQKLTNYLLVYQAKDDKSEFLAGAGYTLQTWEELRQDIVKAVEGAEISEINETEWGMRFLVKSQWRGLNNRLLNVITVWQQDTNSQIVRFITLYPDKASYSEQGE
ncbi:DUF6883 domain-containing protein [Leptolyngbya sp. AN03gr2]|uniref:DUF6883 domain-containing protein n=1 Tax=unclassified Leptolyngbya TaxID=2650499 RepID=UPI003D3163BB